MVKQTAKFSFMEQWNIIKAYDYCYNVTDGTHDSPKQTEFGKYLITSKHIKDNRIDFESAYNHLLIFYKHFQNQNILRIIALILKVLIKYQKMIIIRLLLGVKLINGILL